LDFYVGIRTKILLFLDLMPYILVYVHQRVGWAYCLHLQGSRSPLFTLSSRRRQYDPRKRQCFCQSLWVIFYIRWEYPATTLLEPHISRL